MQGTANFGDPRFLSSRGRRRKVYLRPSLLFFLVPQAFVHWNFFRTSLSEAVRSLSNSIDIHQSFLSASQGKLL
jgi:hypothetical protein